MATYKGLGFDSTNAKTRTGSSSDTVQFATGVTVDKTLEVTENAIIGGNLNVAGTIISTDEQQVLVQDNFLDLNFGYTTNAYEQTGLTFNYQATTDGVTIDTTGNTMTFTARSGNTRAKVAVATGTGIPAGTFADGDIIQINGTTNGDNDGIYVVADNTVAGTIEFRSTAISPADTVNAAFALEDVTAETETTAQSVTIFKVNLMALRSSSAGALQQAAGATDSDFATYTTIGGSQTLQDTYDNGATITTASSTDIAFTLTSGNFTVDSGSVDFGGTTPLSTFDVAASASTLTGSFAGADAILLDASDSAGTVTIQNQGGDVAEFKDASVLFFDRLNGGNQGRLYRVPTNATDDFTIQLEGSTSIDASLILESNGNGADALKIQTVTNAGSIDINSVGAVTIDAVSASNFTVDNANLTLSTTTGGEVDITSAGLMDLNAGANLDIDVTGTFDMLSSGAFSIDGTGASNVTATSGNLTLSTLTSGNIDITAVGTFSIDGAGVSNVTTDSGNLTVSTTTSGNLILTAAGALDLNGNATTLDATTLSIDSTDTTNFTMTANDAADKVLTISASNAGAGGAFIQLGDTNAEPVVLDGQNGTTLLTTSALTLLSGVGQFDLCYISATGWQKADASAASTAFAVAIAGEDASGGAISNGKVGLAGVLYLVDIPTGTPAVGDRIYLSETAGKATLTAPTTAGSVVYQIGFVTDATPVAGTIHAVVFQPQFIIEN